MTAARPPHVVPKHPLPKQPVDHVVTSPTAKVTLVTSTRSAPPVTPPHPAVWQPWTALAADAEGRFKTEITAALAEFRHDAAEAGKILDTAAAMAAEVEGQLVAAAWAAYNRYMTSARESAAAILDPARAGYDAAMGAASGRYLAALADAEQNYRLVLTGAQQAKTDGTNVIQAV